LNISRFLGGSRRRFTALHESAITNIVWCSASYVSNTYLCIPVTQATNVNNAFRLVGLAYDMNTYVFKVNEFTEQATYE